MKKLTQLTLVLLVMVFAFAGCDAAKDAAGGAMDKAKEMADIDIGGVKMSDLTGKITGITDGFADVSEENADGLAEKISGLDETIGGISMDGLPDAAKTAASGVMGPFATTLEGLMAKVPEPIKAKLEPVVAPLMEKLAAFGG